MPIRSAAANGKRIIARLEGRMPGPSVVMLGGVHGNEHAGVDALQTVARHLGAANHLQGRFLALRGNVRALECGMRYLDEDLNRLWTPGTLAAIRATPTRDLASSERREAAELLATIEPFLDAAAAGSEPVVVGDLHSFSAPGSWFGIARHNARNAALFAELGIPMVLGIEDQLQGAAFQHYEQQADVAFVIEGGQHDDPATASKLADALLDLLARLGCIDPQPAQQTSQVEPGLHKVRPVYRHAVQPGDEFVMRPGFCNLQKIARDEWLAEDKHGKIRAPAAGYLLMPLYQAQGSDGFFIAQTVDEG